jgi:HK97 family phage prohead protease
MELERRYLPAADGNALELRDDGGPVIRGISPPWNSPSVDLGGFTEQFSPSAFDRVLNRSRNDPRGRVDVVGLFNHDDNLVLSRTTNNSLGLSKEASGLGWEMRNLPDTQTARDVVSLLRAGLLYGASFGFIVSDKGQHWTEDTKGNPVRTITDADLFDVSVVTWPAYPASSAGLRSLAQWREENLTAAEIRDRVERDAERAAARQREIEASIVALKLARLRAYA